MTDSLQIPPVSRAVKGRIRPPGSKSLTNRALIIAALANGRSRLTGVLDSQDTQVMIESLGRLGIDVHHDKLACVVEIEGMAEKGSLDSAELWLENSGTSIRFLTALCTLGRGTYRLDGSKRMRERPIGDLVAALKLLGGDVSCDLKNDCPPVTVQGRGLSGGKTTVAGDISSQFLSALLMVAPLARSKVDLQLEGEYEFCR